MPVDRKFRKKVKTALANTALRTALGNFALSYPQARETAYKGIDFESLREDIEKIKSHSVDNIEALAREFEQKITARGATVHRAADGEAVAQIIKTIARQRNAKLCVKSKSMATEEIHLNHRLQDALQVVETDLGEWIIQQIQEKPSHMVMPAIHLTKEKCAEIFSRVLGQEVKPVIPQMVKLARKILREQFLAADIGISGCNIAAAETGTLVIFTNEGNGRLTTTLPPVHIVVVGYEKLVPRFKDIAPLAAAIPRSATCQYLTSYVTMISAPSESFKTPRRGDPHKVLRTIFRRPYWSAEDFHSPPGEATGLVNNRYENETAPKELHVIFLDNGRLELFKDPVFKKIGQCIRCASCLNVCPIYTLVGGQVYGDIYAGGIGTLLTAFLESPEKVEKIQELCLSCGKCRETCPAKIEIPGLILELRARVRGQVPPPFYQRLAVEKVLPYKKRLDLSMKTVGPGLRAFDHLHHLPAPAPKTFREVFHQIQQETPPGQKKVGFFYGCMIDYMYPEIGEAVVMLLNRAGYRVELPAQGCCGAPALYLGLENSAKKMAAENLLFLEKAGQDYDYIVTACPTGSVMLKKHWQQLCKNDPAALARAKNAAAKAIEFIRLLNLLRQQGIFPGSMMSPSPGKEIAVTYHYSCHLKRDCGVETEPREVLSAIPGVRWVEMEEADRCCGFAGTYSVKFPGLSTELLERKIKNIEKSGAEIVVVDCPGCLLQLRRGLEKANSSIRVLHSAIFASGGQEPLL